MAPALAAYWDTVKNEMTPDQVMAHSFPHAGIGSAHHVVTAGKL